MPSDATIRLLGVQLLGWWDTFVPGSHLGKCVVVLEVEYLAPDVCSNVIFLMVGFLGG